MTTLAPSLRVLYVEDNPIDVDLARRELSRLAPEIRLDIATTLAAAFEQLAQDCPPFDVVLADMSLPDGSGLELLAQIRERELPLAVVIITGFGDQESAVTALKAGADDYLVKRAEQLGNLSKVLSAAHRNYQKKLERRTKPLRVLYAEPNNIDVDLTRRYLAQHAPYIRLEVVSSGEEVLARLPGAPGDAEPAVDVLLLDLRLQGMNALEVVKALRQDHGLDLPIVLATGQGTVDVAVQALQLGVDDYLVKHEGYLQQLPSVLEKLQKQAELKKSEAEFRSLSQEFNGLLDAIPDSLMLLDRELKILWGNRATADCTGAAADGLPGQLCYTLCYDRTAPCEPCLVLQCFESGAARDETITSSDGRVWDIRTLPLLDEQGRVAKVIELRRDMSEYKKLEMQYLHAQKMESVGTLTGGIAHDFNNILTAIAGFASLLRLNLGKDYPFISHVDNILTSAERGANLVKSLLAFSRKQAFELKAVDLNEFVAKEKDMLGRLIRADIGLTVSTTEHPLPVMVDQGQMVQILMNLTANARDAMPQGGAIKISTASLELDKEFVTAHGFGTPGKYALIAFSDSGCGMDEETQRRIFEPFFTTKEVGKGTGLGLATVYGIVKQLNGFLNCYSELGRGTTFKIYLPLIPIMAEQLTVMTSPEPLGGTETILLAEDDEMVRELLRSVLQQFGYTVIEAVNGDDALAKFRQQPDSIQLAILDVIMPKKDGRQVYEEICELRPGVRAIFTSGYPAEAFQNNELLDDSIAFISKPVSPNELLLEIRKVLDTR